MLISAVLPIMSLYHLPHRQYSYSGHVINLPQDANHSYMQSTSNQPTYICMSEFNSILKQTILCIT